MRAIQKGQIRASYTLTDYTKSLGSMVANDGSFRFERSARAEAVHKAKFQLGARITSKSKRVPYKIRRMPLIGHVQNFALSGVEAYALLRGDYDFLDRLVIKNTKKQWAAKRTSSSHKPLII